MSSINDDGYCLVSSVKTSNGKEILQNMAIDFPTSGITAILGPSGSGKTTISNLLPRFYDIQGGDITIDGHKIKDLKLGDLRELMGVVNQESILFNDTVLNNIRLGVPDATEEEVIKAAKVANAWEFIEKNKGSISVSSKVGEGTTFTIKLPQNADS